MTDSDRYQFIVEHGTIDLCMAIAGMVLKKKTKDQIDSMIDECININIHSMYKPMAPKFNVVDAIIKGQNESKD